MNIEGTDKSEFRSGWPIVLAATAGSGLGVSALLTYTAGLFVNGLEAEIGLSRTEFGLGVFGATLSVALASIFVGRMVDLEGPRRAAGLGALFLAIGFAAMATLVHSPVTYVGLMLITGLLASGSSPVPYARAVSHAFARRRGLALGLMQMGIGISAALVPPSLGLVISQGGWRAGYFALAGVALLGLLPAMLALPKNATRQDVSRADRTPIARSREFWLMLVGFATMALAFAGMLPHFVPMLIDLGVSPLRAAFLAGLIGLSVIVVRVAVGWLADLVHAPWIAASACLLCAAGCLLLSFGGAAAAPVGAIALGAAMGAEADLVGFLVARYFPLASYGRIYALQYAAFMTAAGTGPLWVGAVADATGGYHAALIISAVLLTLAIVPFLLLPKSLPSNSQPA
jgi:MFS family permease